MQRPTRMVVFGVLCLVIGGLSGVKNTMEGFVALIGAEGLTQMMAMMEEMDQPLSASQRDDFALQVRVHRQPIYRVGQLIESSCSTVMAGVMIVAGIGLLRGRGWALKLTRWWAYYAIPAAGVSVVLYVRYMLPAMPDASAGGGLMQGAVMLLSLWIFPVLLLSVLPTDAVKAYLLARQGQAKSPARPMSSDAASGRDAMSNGPLVPTLPSSEVRQAASDVPASRSADTTWRDDPWND